MAIQPSWAGNNPLLHEARHFSRLPDRKEASSLLEQLATAPCPFTPGSADRPLALYGAGNLGRLARDFLRSPGFRSSWSSTATPGGWRTARTGPEHGCCIPTT